jgi:Transposase IS4
VKTPVELSSTKRDGSQGNKTQAVAFQLLESLLGTGYYCFMDNLFISTRFLEFLRTKDYGATGIYYTNTGVISELLE